MNIVLRLVLAPVAILTAAILGTRWLGAGQAHPLATLFSMPDGASCAEPCLFGIRPGKTEVVEAFELLQAHPLTGHLHFRGGGEIRDLYEFDSPSSEVQFEARYGVVASVTVNYTQTRHSGPLPDDLEPLSRPLRLGAVVSGLGPPHAFYLFETQARKIVIWCYPKDSGVVTACLTTTEVARIDIADPLLSFMLISDSLSLALRPPPGLWLGFSALEKYVERYGIIR